MRIRNAEVFGTDLMFRQKEIGIRDGFFTEDTEEPGEEILDASGCYAVPGLIDIHFHGALGYDVCDGTEEAFAAIAEYELSEGITSICPATLTLPVTELEDILRTGAAFARKKQGADLVGFNMEGPFISRVKKGAQNEKYIIPASKNVVDRFVNASGGLVKFIGLAPEDNPDFEEYIASVKDKVRVSLAHTNADYETAMRAFSAGASHAVHLYNAMTGLSHRAPGVVGAVSDSRNVNAELICDGVHIHPGAVHAAYRMVGRDRIVFISDSLRSTGMPDGKYILGGQEIEKKGKFCRLVSDGNLAGSVTNLTGCMRTAVLELGVPLEDAVAASTFNAARSIGLEDRIGSIAPGKKGDLVLLKKDAALSLAAVIKDGRIVVNHLS